MRLVMAAYVQKCTSCLSLLPRISSATLSCMKVAQKIEGHQVRAAWSGGARLGTGSHKLQRSGDAVHEPACQLAPLSSSPGHRALLCLAQIRL